jgi:hypothetical protein
VGDAARHQCRGTTRPVQDPRTFEEIDCPGLETLNTASSGSMHSDTLGLFLAILSYCKEVVGRGKAGKKKKPKINDITVYTPYQSMMGK